MSFKPFISVSREVSQNGVKMDLGDKVEMLLYDIMIWLGS